MPCVGDAFFSKNKRTKAGARLEWFLLETHFGTPAPRSRKRRLTARGGESATARPHITAALKYISSLPGLFLKGGLEPWPENTRRFNGPKILFDPSTGTVAF